MVEPVLGPSVWVLGVLRDSGSCKVGRLVKQVGYGKGEYEKKKKTHPLQHRRPQDTPGKANHRTGKLGKDLEVGRRERDTSD